MFMVLCFGKLGGWILRGHRLTSRSGTSCSRVTAPVRKYCLAISNILIRGEIILEHIVHPTIMLYIEFYLRRVNDQLHRVVIVNCSLFYDD